MNRRDAIQLAASGIAAATTSWPTMLSAAVETKIAEVKHGLSPSSELAWMFENRECHSP